MPDNTIDNDLMDLLIGEDDPLEADDDLIGGLALALHSAGPDQQTLNLSLVNLSIDMAIAMLEEALEILEETGIIDDED